MEFTQEDDSFDEFVSQLCLEDPGDAQETPEVTEGEEEQGKLLKEDDWGTQEEEDDLEDTILMMLRQSVLDQDDSCLQTNAASTPARRETVIKEPGVPDMLEDVSTIPGVGRGVMINVDQTTTIFANLLAGDAVQERGAFEVDPLMEAAAVPECSTDRPGPGGDDLPLEAPVQSGGDEVEEGRPILVGAPTRDVPLRARACGRQGLARDVVGQ